MGLFNRKKTKQYEPTRGFRKIVADTIGFLSQGTAFGGDNGDVTYVEEGYVNPTVYSIINTIIRNSLSVPVKIYEVKDDAKAKEYDFRTKNWSPQNQVHANVLKHGAFSEVNSGEIVKLIQTPNTYQSWSGFISDYIGYGKLTGDRYIYGIKNGQGKVKEMHILPSHRMEIVKGSNFDPIKGYRLDLMYHGVANNDFIDFKKKEILHIKDFNPFYSQDGDHLYGMSPLRAGLKSLRTNEEAVNTAKKQLQSQMARGLLVTEDYDTIDSEQMKELDSSMKRKFKRDDGGISITNVPLKWIDFGLSATDMGLIEQSGATAKELCNLYGFPAILLNMFTAGQKDGLKEGKTFLFENTIIPELIRLRDELNTWLVPAYGKNYYLDFDFTVIPELQENVTELVDRMEKGYYITPNEKRKALGYSNDSDPNMDKYYFPVNLMPLDNMQEMGLNVQQGTASGDAIAASNLPEQGDK